MGRPLGPPGRVACVCILPDVSYSGSEIPRTQAKPRSNLSPRKCLEPADSVERQAITSAVFGGYDLCAQPSVPFEVYSFMQRFRPPVQGFNANFRHPSKGTGVCTFPSEQDDVLHPPGSAYNCHPTVTLGCRIMDSSRRSICLALSIFRQQS